ncbi:hypothetical protein [Phenylobacterium sp.]|uniref:hypothetical protein n=1 Tax=Phenylobacterium sp. TaxID=1871053 RepID=UPI002C2F6C7C|nr:hypothetical protein [Phenylobacterium sp.]HLZ76272.1 hypothetical protein [Phenylobacterium sp.]
MNGPIRWLALAATVSLATAPAAASAQDRGAAPVIAYTTQKESAGFVLRRGSTAILSISVIGLGALVADGAHLVSEEHLVDPSAALAHDVAAHVAERVSGTLAPAPVEISTQRPKEIAAAAAAAASGRLVVNARTIGWGTFAYHLHGIYFSYTELLQVIDGPTGAVLVSDYCSWPKADPNPVSTDDLLADHAKELRRRIDEGTKACLTEFLAKVDSSKALVPG